MRQNMLLTEEEIARCKAFKGFKSFLPINWALDEVDARLHFLQTQEDGAMWRHRDVVYTDFERCAFSFRTGAGFIVSQLAAPVPFPYFHVVKLLLLVTLTMTGYALLGLLKGHFFFTLGSFSVICLIMIALQAH
jgi:hypothetical protein